MMKNEASEQLEERGVVRVGFKALMRAVLRHRLAAAGIVIIAALVGMAVFAPWISPYDPNKQDLYAVLKGPSAEHWLGTDNVGRDLLSRIIYGSRVSLYVGLVSTAFAAAIGILIGLVAGYRGGMIDNIFMRVTDTFMCFPFLIFVLAMAAALGPGINNIILSIALLGWTGFARIIRGQVLTVRELPYIEAARAVGVSRTGIMFRHVLPNSLAPVIVAASITIGAAIMTEASTRLSGSGGRTAHGQLGQGTARRLHISGPSASFFHRAGADGDPGRAGLQFPRRRPPGCPGPPPAGRGKKMKGGHKD